MCIRDRATKDCTSALVLAADGTYTLTVTKDGKESYTGKGTFETAASPMGVSLTLKSDKGATATLSLIHIWKPAWLLSGSYAGGGGKPRRAAGRPS